MNKTKEIKKLKKEIKRLHNEIECLYTGLFLVNQAMKLQTENAENLESRLEDVEYDSADVSENLDYLASLIKDLAEAKATEENQNNTEQTEEKSEKQPVEKKRGKKDEESK